MYVYQQLWHGSTSSLVSILLAVCWKALSCGLWSAQKACRISSCIFPIWCFSSPPIPTMGSCFSLIFLLISPSWGYHMYTVPSQSYPEENLRAYFPSKVDLFKGECPCFGFLVLLLRQTFLRVEFFSWVSTPTWVFWSSAVPYLLRLLWNFHSPALFLDLNHLDILLLISSWFL